MFLCFPCSWGLGSDVFLLLLLSVSSLLSSGVGKGPVEGRVRRGPGDRVLGAPEPAGPFQQERVAPYGAMGGGEELGRHWVVRAETGKTEALGSCDQAEVGPGDVFVVQTPSGGGYGLQE